MDWNRFFEDTRRAAGADSYAKLAPMLGISDGAISHYRTGKRVPSVTVIAAALRVQHHPTPEQEAVRILVKAAGTSEERGFWKRLAATLLIVIALSPMIQVHARATAEHAITASIEVREAATTTVAVSKHYAKC